MNEFENLGKQLQGLGKTTSKTGCSMMSLGCLVLAVLAGLVLFGIFGLR